MISGTELGIVLYTQQDKFSCQISGLEFNVLHSSMRAQLKFIEIYSIIILY